MARKRIVTETTATTRPGAPTSLSASVTSTTADLSWTAPTDDGGSPITEYQYRYQEGTTATGGTWTDTNSTTPSFTVTNLTANTQYTFQVRTLTSVGNSQGNPSVTETTLAAAATVPGAPTSLSATAQTGGTSVELDWTAPSDNGGAAISDYDVRYQEGSTAGGTWTALGQTTTSYTVSSLDKGTEYTFQVRAVNSVGDSAASSSDTTTTLTTVPGAPTSLSATAETGGTSMALAWTAPTDTGGSAITDYQLRYQVGSTAGGTWTSLGQTTTSYTQTGLDKGTEYTFQVRAITSVGNSISNPSDTETTLTTRPGAPTSFDVSVTQTTADLSWTAPTDDGGSPITEYQYRFTTGTSVGGTWTDTDDTATTLTISSLTADTEYTFQVRTITSVAVSQSNPSVTETTQATVTTVPGAPTSLSVTTGETTADLSWTAPTDTGGTAITEYQYRFTTGSTAGGTWTDTDSTAVSVTISSLTADTEYTFQVRAVNSVGNSVASTAVTATTDAEPVVSTGGELTGAVVRLGTTTGFGVSEGNARAGDGDGTNLFILGNLGRLIKITDLANGTGEFASATIGPTGRTPVGLAWHDGSFYCSIISSGDHFLYRVDPPFTATTAPTFIADIGVQMNTLVSDGTTLFGISSSVFDYYSINPTTGALTDLGTVTDVGGVHGSFFFEDELYALSNTDNALFVLDDNLAGTQVGAFTNFDVSEETVRGGGALGDERYLIGRNIVYRFLQSDTPTTTSVPDAPTSLTATAQTGGTSVELDWTAPDDGGATITEYQYRYQEGTTAGGTWTDTDSTTTSHTITGLDKGTEYTFQVRARNSEGEGDASNTDTVTTLTTTPNAPTSLSATTTRTTAILTWTAPTDDGGTPITEYQYRYQEGSTAGGAWTDTNSTAVTFTISSLDPSTEYTFQVRAVNSAGNSAASSAVTESTLTTVPGAPTGLSATAQTGGTSVELDWTAPTNNGGSTIIDYEVSSDDGGTWNSTGSATTSYTVTGLDKGTEYIFRVRAVNSPHGDGDASASVTETTLTTRPDPPTNLTVSVTQTTADLSWTAPTDTGGSPITEYQYRFTTGTSVGGTWTDTDDTATSVTISSLTADTEYTFQVRAITSVGNSQSNPSVTETTLSVSVSLPSAPQTLTATAQTNGTSMALSWAAPSDNGGAAISDYEYRYAEGTSVPSADSWTAPGSTNTARTITGLDKGTEYTFEVRAVNSEGGGTEASVTETTATTVPGAPTSLTATADSNGTEVDLAWVAPTDGGGSAITEYQYRFTTGTTAGGTWIDTNSTTPSFTVTALDKGTQYTFQVRTVTSVGNSASNPSVTETTATTIPGAPGGLSVTTSDTTATLEWDAPTDDGGSALTDYEIRYAEGASAASGTWTSAGVTDTEYALSMLTAGTGYAFQVRAINLVGDGTPSLTRTFTPGAVLSIEVLDAQALTLDTDYAIEVEITGDPDEVTAEGKWDGWYYDWDANTELLTISGNANTVLSDATWALTATKGTESVEEDVDYSVAPPAPVITEPQNLTITAGTDYEATPIAIAIANSPSVVRMEGLLLGLYFEVTGTVVEIKGMLPSDVELTVTSGTLEIYASNGGGEDTVTPSFTIN